MSEGCLNSNQRSKEFVPKTGPIVGSLSVIVGWLVFILAYALYWSKGFDLFQNAIVTVVSLATAGMLVCGMMLVWYRVDGELRRKPRETASSPTRSP